MKNIAGIEKNIVFIGLPGCGKTSIGRAVASRLSMNFYDVDECIEKKEGKLIKDIFLQGEEYFRETESKVIQEVSRNCSSVISTGGGVIKVSSNMEILKRNSMIIFINRPLKNIMMDIDTSARPLLKEGAVKLFNLYEERYALYKKYCDIEVNNDIGFKDIVDKIVKLVEC